MLEQIGNRGGHKNMGMPEGGQGTEAYLRQVNDEFTQEYSEFGQSGPNFFSIIKKIEEIDGVLKMYFEDFNILLEEPLEKGGGVKNNSRLLLSMRQDVGNLEQMITEAESLIKQNPNFKSFIKQVVAAKKAMEALKRI